MLARRAPGERPDRPFAGFKLAHAVLAADAGRAGFAGLSMGAQRVYGATAEASCVWSQRHVPPRRRCSCGFYCLNSLAEARALSCATENRDAVLLEVVASGRFIRYERGLRYSRQRVRAVRVGPCGCGRPARGLADAGRGLVGWRGLMPACAACGARRRPHHVRQLRGPARRPDPRHSRRGRGRVARPGGRRPARCRGHRRPRGRDRARARPPGSPADAVQPAGRRPSRRVVVSGRIRARRS